MSLNRVNKITIVCNFKCWGFKHKAFALQIFTGSLKKSDKKGKREKEKNINIVIILLDSSVFLKILIVCRVWTI